jgi:hypothetical protein
VKSPKILFAFADIPHSGKNGYLIEFEPKFPELSQAELKRFRAKLGHFNFELKLS